MIDKMASSAVSAVNGFITSGQYHTILSILKGFRNGAVYGAKVRFPHALVMTFLFKGGPIKEQARAILQATYTHSRNLACFVLAYKALCAALLELQGKPSQLHSFIAAFIGGYLVFGKYNKINEQINLYLLSRILYGLVKLGLEKKVIPQPKREAFPWFAALVWGIVLWQFEYHKRTLQPSLQHSMTYLYHDSNVWTSLKNFLIYNK